MNTNQDFEQIYALYKMQGEQQAIQESSPQSGLTNPSMGQLIQTNEQFTINNRPMPVNGGQMNDNQEMMSPSAIQGGQEQIVAVRKNHDGDLIAFKTNTGRELDYLTALAEAKAGKLAHVDVFHKYGRDILRSEPDGIKANNLDQLPPF